MQIMLLSYKNIFSVSDDMPWHRLRQHRRGGIMAKHMGYHESVPPGLSLNVTNLRNALIAVGTCHGMSADVRPLFCMVLGDMPWHVPTT